MRLTLITANPLEEIASKTLFKIGWFEFTNHMLMIGVAAILLLIILPLSVGKIRIIRRGFGNVIETICVFIREEIARPFLKDDTDKYVMVLWTLFFFILTMNLLGLVPSDRIIWLITQKKNHLYGAPTGNIWVTGALALFSFIFFHAAGIKQNGIKNYIKDFCPKVPWIMWPPMFCLEVISSFVRMFSLAIRLFANILAGHILLATILGFIILYKNFMVATASISFTVVMSFLEIFVAFLQAYIFTFLTAIFIGFAIHPEH
ncbi:MAG: F0F1 ATP synthase subunit A [Sedimentisphaeraceae bacterium JB056]